MTTPQDKPTSVDDDLSAETFRKRCYTCFRPVTSCFCDAIPRIDNCTEMLILQHVKERFHAFNTARIVKSALSRCRLLVDQTPSLAAASLPIQAGAGVLYPGPDSIPLEGLDRHARPPQLVILDGTWHHAKTLMREIPALQWLPKYCLTPERPSDYRIRRPPSDTALSTLEAVAAALKLLEPDTPRVGELLSAFHRMVEDQLQHPTRSARIRKRNALPRPSVNIPTVLLRNPENVVVAYGETSFGRSGKSRRDRSLVYWVAKRLISGETFAATIKPDFELTPEFLSHLQLGVQDFRDAITAQQFFESWTEFIRPNDSLCVFNASTAAALKRFAADVLPVVSLKSVNLDKDSHSLDELLAKLQLRPDPIAVKGRAGQRLANACSYAKYLSTFRGSQHCHDEPEADGPSG